LARRNGFECFVQGRERIFSQARVYPIHLTGVAAHFGGETQPDVVWASLNALRRPKSRCFRSTPSPRKTLDANLEKEISANLAVTVRSGLVPKRQCFEDVRQTGIGH